jgi:hypothetical protein
LDQNEVDVLALERGRERKKRTQYFKDRKKLVRSMDGQPNLDFFTDKMKSSLTTEESLAMEHFVLLKTLNKLKEEQNTLTKLVHKDSDDIEVKFARIGIKRAADRARMRTAGSSLSSKASFDSSWGNLSAPKDGSRTRNWKRLDTTVYSADGRWNESGLFVVARTDKEKVGLMSSKYARVTGDAAPEVLTRRRKTEVFKMEMSSAGRGA